MLASTPIHISYTNLLGLIINDTGEIRYITKPLVKLLGYTIESLVGTDISSLLHKKDLNRLEKFVLSLNEKDSQAIHDFESELLTKNKQELHLNLKLIQLFNSFTNSYSYAIISDNVIYRNYVNYALEVSNFQIKGLYDIAHEMILILNNEKKFIYLNEYWKEKLGTSATNKSPFVQDYFDAETINEIVTQVSAITTKRSTTKLSIKVKAPQKETYFYLSGYLVSENTKNNEFIYQFILNDVSEEIRAEKVKNLYFNISNQIVQNHDLQTIYRNIHNELKEVISCENLYIALYDPLKDEIHLYFPYFQDKNHTDKSGLKRAFGKGITEYVIKNKKPLSLTKAALVNLVNNNKVDLLGEIPEHWMGVPLNTPDKVIGVIAIQSYAKNIAYTNTDLTLLDFASSQIAMAIEMAKTREELQNQTAQLNAIFDSSSHLIWSVNKDLDVTSFNKNYFEANFISHDVAADETDNGLVEDNSFNQFWVEKYKRAFAGEKLQFEINLKDESDNIIWKEIHLNPIYNFQNKIIEVSGIAHDITPKKQSELALLKSEEKFRNIFESFQDLYFRCNLQGNIIMVSPSVIDMMGYNAHEVLGKHIDDYYLYNPRAKHILKELKSEINLKNVEISIVKKNGEVRQCICNIRMVQNNPNEPFEIEGVVRDITQLKITNQQLINANEIAENSLRVKEKFLANMSHEIRTPMNGIIGMIDLLDNTNLDESQKNYINTLKKSSTVLMDILNDILDLAKIEAGRMKINTTTFSLPNVVAKIHALFTPLASTKKVSLNYHLKPSLPEFIATDETRLIQILSNLISNSLKFTNQGGSIDIGFELINQQNNEALIRVDVRDSGIGISEENQKMLFKSFEQLDNSTTKAYGGTGLGLAISKQLATFLGGQIGVSSNPGLGSTFWFTFKAEIPDSKTVAQVEKTKSEQSVKTTQLKNKSVLVVDDNQINREVAREILTKAGCKVMVAASGEEAISLVDGHSYDVILMDIQMPGMDGVETTQQLKKLHLTKLPKVIAMTAYAMKEDKEKFLNQGLDDYLAKPIRAQNLINKVNDIVSIEGSTPAIPSIDDEDIPSTLNLDVVAQLKKYGGEEIIDTVYDDFTIETDQQINEAFNALETQNMEAIRKLLHTIKGTAGTLGVDKVASMARIIEFNLKQKNISTFKTDFKKLIDNFDEFKKSYKELI